MTDLRQTVMALRPTFYIPRLYGGTGGGDTSFDIADRTRIWYLTDTARSATWPGLPGDPESLGAYFDGTGDRWSATDSKFWVSGSSPASWMGWIRRTTASTTFPQIMARHTDLSTGHFHLRINNTDKAEFVYFAGGAAGVVTGTQNISDGDWHAIFATYREGTTTDNRARIYVDDGPAQATSATYTAQTPNNSEAIVLGARRVDTGTEPMTGDLAHLAYWSNYALTAADRQRIYLAGMKRLAASDDRGRMR